MKHKGEGKMVQIKTEQEEEEITECDVIIAITNLENFKQRFELTNIEIQVIDIVLFLLRKGLENKCWFNEKQIKKQTIKGKGGK